MISIFFLLKLKNIEQLKHFWKRFCNQFFSFGSGFWVRLLWTTVYFTSGSWNHFCVWTDSLLLILVDISHFFFFMVECLTFVRPKHITHIAYNSHCRKRYINTLFYTPFIYTSIYQRYFNNLISDHHPSHMIFTLPLCINLTLHLGMNRKSSILLK